MDKLLKIAAFLICITCASVSLASDLEAHIYKLLQTKYESGFSDPEGDYYHAQYFLEETMVIENTTNKAVDLKITLEINDDGTVEQYQTNCQLDRISDEIYCDYFYE